MPETPPAGDARRENQPGQLHVAIIGGGSEAFACALRVLEQHGRVTLIERDRMVGGTCVNVGCVPSKIMIRSAQLAHLQRSHPFKGLERHRPRIDRAALLQQQQARVDALRAGKYEDLLKAHDGITRVRGEARFRDARTLVVARDDGGTHAVTADRFLIATGSSPVIPSIPGLSGTPFWTSTEALATEKLPKRLLVIGAGIVALELGQAFLRLGSEITLVARHRPMYREDPAIGSLLQKILEKEGMRILTDARVQSVEYRKSVFSSGQFTLKTTKGAIRGEHLLIATGRAANTGSLGLDKADVQTEGSGAVRVDDHLRTSAPHIFAAGDCTALPRFVYVAAAAGVRAAINLTGGDASLDLATTPVVMFTDPQMALVGLDESRARARNIEVESRSLNLDQIPRALVNFETRGFVKLLAEKTGGRLLGAQILAPEAGEMIQSAALAIRNRMTVEALAGQLFPYLTMVEGLKLCAQTFTRDVSRLSCCAG